MKALKSEKNKCAPSVNKPSPLVAQYYAFGPQSVKIFIKITFPVIKNPIFITEYRTKTKVH